MLDRLQHLPVGALVPLILLATLATAGIWAIAHSIRAGRHRAGITKPRKEKPQQ